MRVLHKMFRATLESWDDLFKDAAEFASGPTAGKLRKILTADQPIRYNRAQKFRKMYISFVPVTDR